MRRSLVALTLFGVGCAAPAAADEAEAVATARIGAAFHVLVAPPPLNLDAPAPRSAPAVGVAASAPVAAESGAPAAGPAAPPPADVPFAGMRGEEPPEMGYAAATASQSPAERVFAIGPQPVPVPLPRRRPSVPTVASQVAALDAAAAVGAPEHLAETPPILAEDGILGPPRKIPKQALPYLRLLEREAARNKVPLWLAIGVGWVESKYDPNLRGSHTVLGLMQVMPSTARYQGYRGTTEGLLDPETNIVWGMKELGWTWAAAKGDPCLAIAKYKGGIATKSISAAAADYCRRAKAVTGML
jgi:soluble lytic murein transglycosylase-like protein